MKKKFENWDSVKLAKPYQGKYEYGKIEEYNEKSKCWRVQICDLEHPFYSSVGTVDIPENELTYLPRFVATEEFIKKLLRYELTSADYEKYITPLCNWECNEFYEYTLEDIVVMLENLKKKKPSTKEMYEWAVAVFVDFSENYLIIDRAEYNEEDAVLGFRYPKNDAAMAIAIYDAFYDTMYEPEAEIADINISLMLEDIENYKNQRAIKQHFWSLGCKLSIINNIGNEINLDKLSDEEKRDLKMIISELVEKEYSSAIRALGYCYYGGNALFPCDWNKSRDCFLKLLEMDSVHDVDKCYYANTLGYIFYYGRCNGGVPEYEKAYKYFSLGAAGGVYESTYKLSDMYLHGYGVEKNGYAALTLVRMVYDENYSLIKNGNFDCKFADAALRIGNLCRDGVWNEDEYYYYTLADFAIRKRMPYNHYGDAKVFSAIQKELAKIREKTPLEKAVSFTEDFVPDIFYELFEKHSCLVTLKPLKKGIKITAKRLPQPGCYQAESIFECYPERGYCDLVSEVSITVKGENLPRFNKKMSFIADNVVGNWPEAGVTFKHHGEKIIFLEVEQYTRRLSKQVEAITCSE